MPIRVLVNGASGRMGQLVVKVIENHPDFLLVGQTKRQDALLKTIQNTQAKVVVDFTHPSAVYQNTLAIIEAGAHPVIGTSGLLPDQVKELQAQCEIVKLGGIIAPNFSIGVALMMKHAQELAKYFPEVEIIEMHHDGKRDCPSGTALYTAQALANSREKYQQPTRELHENIPGSRGANHLGVPIHAIRLPGLVAHEQIIFGGLGETLTLKHDTLDRQCFMQGVCLACKAVSGLDRLVYGLEQIL